MSNMPDLQETLLSFQDAYAEGLIDLVPCSIHPEIKLHGDEVNGQTRLTYARIDGETVKAIVVFLMVEPHKGKPCFQVGYAVAEQFRCQGIATDTVKRSLNELRQGSKRHTKNFYLEAIVAADNIASRKVAERVICPTGEDISDAFNGEPALQFMQLVKC